MNSENFQKELALIQIRLSVVVTLGAVITSFGVAVMSLYSGLSLPDNIRSQFDLISQIMIYLGIGVFIGGAVVLRWRLKKIKLDEVTDVLNDNPEKSIPIISKNENLNKPTNNFMEKLRIKLIVIGLISLSIIEAIIILVPYDDPRVLFDYKFFTDIILILIPSGCGIVTSKWVTHSWQTKREKHEIKRKILDEYKESIPIMHYLLVLFDQKLVEAYMIVESDSINLVNESERMTPIKFPSEEKEKPSTKFKKDYDKLQDEYWEINHKNNTFTTTLRLYYDEEFEGHFYQIRKKFGDAYLLTSSLLNAKDESEFTKISSMINDKLIEGKTLMKKFELDLIAQKPLIR